MKRLFTRLTTCLVALTCAAATAPAADTYVIRAERIHVGDGKTIDNAAVIVVDGRITAVGPNLPVPQGATIVNVRSGHITPGLIDANAQIEARDIVTPESPRNTTLGMFMPELYDHDRVCSCASPFNHCPIATAHEELEPGGTGCPCCGFPAPPAPGEQARLASGLSDGGLSRTEASSEVVPHTRVLDSLNLDSPDWDRLLRGGVTTVYVSPDTSAVIGPAGAIVRTPRDAEDRILEDDAAITAAFGSDPMFVGGRNLPPFRGFITLRTRRPNTRMGVTWVFRKAFYDTMRVEAGLPVFGADTAPESAFPVLSEVLEGDRPLRVHARLAHDIESAKRLCDEFEVPFVLVEGNEAHNAMHVLKDGDVPVIFGPITDRLNGVRRRLPGVNKPRLDTVAELIHAGVPTAITAIDLREEDGLARQAMYATRFGLSDAEAIRAVTLTPAEILGIDDELGSVETGKRADLVLWSGEPLSPTSRPVVVMVDGKIELDQR